MLVLVLVLATCGVCSDFHGEGVAACGSGFIARRRAPAVWRHAARRSGERASATPLRAWRPGARAPRLRAGTVSNRQPLPRPRGAADEWARDLMAVAVAAPRSCAPRRGGNGIARRPRAACAARWPGRTTATPIQQKKGSVGGGGPERRSLSAASSRG
jgi:hypothetical protein